MATKSKTTTKPRTAKKTVKGSGGIKKNNTNWTFIIVLLVLVTAVGGFFAYRSQVKAAIGTVWNVKKNNPNPVSNWGGKFPKDDGSAGWEGGPNNWIKIRATFTSANINNKTYCAEGKYIGSDWAIVANNGYSNGGRPASKPNPVNTGGDGWKVCTTAHSATQVGDWIELYICGRSQEISTPTNPKNTCTTGKVTGSIQVQDFYRP